mmetsp:Transcript_28927/g.84799  ORF Transcript_28927/g.84799 Transcript_28927/m.84799 type:complete len:848 (-) Transcript_28927:442-2985(-)
MPARGPQLRSSAAAGVRPLTHVISDIHRGPPAAAAGRGRCHLRSVTDRPTAVGNRTATWQAAHHPRAEGLRISHIAVRIFAGTIGGHRHRGRTGASASEAAACCAPRRRGTTRHVASPHPCPYSPSPSPPTCPAPQHEPAPAPATPCGEKCSGLQRLTGEGRGPTCAHGLASAPPRASPPWRRARGRQLWPGPACAPALCAGRAASAPARPAARVRRSPAFPVAVVLGGVGADGVLLARGGLGGLVGARLEGGLEPVVVERVPVEAQEEGVHLHVVRVVLEVAQALGRLGVQQRGDEGLHVRGEGVREDDLVFQYLDVHGLHVVVGRLEGRAAREELEEQHAAAPPVHGEVVGEVLDDLGAEVARRAALREGLGAHHEPLGEAQVNHLDVARPVHEHVLRLEVAVDHVLLVHVLQGEHHAGDVEARVVLGEGAADVVLDVKEVTAGQVLDEHVYPVRVLVGVEHAADAGVRHHVRHQVPLLEHVVAAAGDLLLRLERVLVLGAVVLHEEDEAVGALAHLRNGGQHGRVARVLGRAAPADELLRLLERLDGGHEEALGQGEDHEGGRARHHRGHARFVVHERALAEEVALVQVVDLLGADEHVHLPVLDDVELVARVAHAEDGVALLELLLHEVGGELLAHARVQHREQGDGAHGQLVERGEVAVEHLLGLAHGEHELLARDVGDLHVLALGHHLVLGHGGAKEGLLAEVVAGVLVRNLRVALAQRRLPQAHDVQVADLVARLEDHLAVGELLHRERRGEAEALLGRHVVEDGHGADELLVGAELALLRPLEDEVEGALGEHVHRRVRLWRLEGVHVRVFVEQHLLAVVLARGQTARPVLCVVRRELD